MMTLVILTVASALYVLGGIAMKYSNAFSEFVPSVLVFVFFCMAAAAQTWTMNKAELSRAYIFVLGLEAVLALFGGAILFHEPLTTSKVLGVILIVLGIYLLKI